MRRVAGRDRFGLAKRLSVNHLQPSRPSRVPSAQGSGSSRGSNVWYAMPSSYRQAIALTLLYSKQLWNSNYSV